MTDFLDSINELSQRVDSVLKKKTFLRPTRRLVWFDYLSCSELVLPYVHHYLVIPKSSPLVITIIHGHYENEQCYANAYCHELGFKPDPNVHNPSFCKMFNNKWKGIYEERRSNN